MARVAEHDMRLGAQMRDLARARRAAAPARRARPFAWSPDGDRRSRPWRGARRAPRRRPRRCSAATRMRRIAVHFCPALTVISRATSLMKMSNSGASGVTSAPRMQQLSESRSAVKCTALASRFGMSLQPRRSFERAGEADAVLRAQMIEQVVRRAADELQRAGRQDCRSRRSAARPPRRDRLSRSRAWR